MAKRFVYRVAPQRQQGADITWQDLLDRLIAEKTRLGRTPKYVSDLENGLTRAHDTLIGMGVRRPLDMNKHVLAQYLVIYQRETGAAPLSVNHQAQKLLTEFSFAYEEEIFPTNLLGTFRKAKVKPSKHNLVKIEEINLVLDEIARTWDPEHAPASRFRSEQAREFFWVRDTCMTLWLGETGCRVGEMARALLPDLNVEERSAVFRDTKNGDEARKGYYTEAFRDGILAEWLAIRNEIDAPSNYLFVSEYGLAMDPYRWGRQWDKYRQRAGIERRIRRHDLRHFSSTAHDRVDKDLSKKQIGHHTDAAHAIYSHREEEELRQAHDKADPVGPILVRLAERKAAAEAAQAAQEKPKGKKVYAKRESKQK